MILRDCRLCSFAILASFPLAIGATAQSVAPKDAVASTATPDIIPVP